MPTITTHPVVLGTANNEDGDPLRTWAGDTNANFTLITDYLAFGSVVGEVTNGDTPTGGVDGDWAIDRSTRFLWIKSGGTWTEDDGVSFGGAAGTNGTNGQGVVTGGVAGEALMKIDGTPYNTEWNFVAQASQLITIRDDLATSNEFFKWDGGNQELTPEALLEFNLSGTPHGVGKIVYGTGSAFVDTTLEMDLVTDVTRTAVSDVAGQDFVLAWDTTTETWIAKAQAAAADSSTTRKFCSTNSAALINVAHTATIFDWGVTATPPNTTLDNDDICNWGGDGTTFTALHMKVAGQFTFTVNFSFKTQVVADTDDSYARLLVYHTQAQTPKQSSYGSATFAIDTDNIQYCSVLSGASNGSRNSMSITFAYEFEQDDWIEFKIERNQYPNDGSGPDIDIDVNQARIYVEA